jgi:hypothetical protein
VTCDGTPYGSAQYWSSNIVLTFLGSSQSSAWLARNAVVFSTSTTDALQAFEAQMNIYIGDGTGADGMSFSYSNLPSSLYTNVGEVGEGNGLRLAIRTYPTKRLEAYYGSSTSTTPFATSATFETRTASWVTLVVRVLDRKLTVWHNNVARISATTITGWNPADGWRYVKRFLHFVHLLTPVDVQFGFRCSNWRFR